jgi:spore germination protein KB
MSNKATVTSAQVIAVLLIFRLAFSTNGIAGIDPGSSIQDILLAVPVVFVINLIIAIPIFMLLKRHPGKDLLECSSQIFGNGIGFVICMMYSCFFVLISSFQLGTFQMYFGTYLFTQTNLLIIAVPVLIVCAYGAIKGIESIMRYGIFALILYLIITALVFITTLPNVDLDYLKPIFYDGPKYFWQAVLLGVNSSFQILLLAMFVPFLKPGTKIVRLYIVWDALTMLFLCVLEFFVITNMGPFASKQLFPLVALSMISKLSVFVRIDNFDMISWIFNTILNICVGLFVTSQCLMRTSLRKWRRTVIAISSVFIIILGGYFSNNYLQNLNIYNSLMATVLTITFIIAVPLIVLMTDVIKGKVAENEEAG